MLRKAYRRCAPVFALTLLCSLTLPTLAGGSQAVTSEEPCMDPLVVDPRDFVHAERGVMIDIEG